MNEAQKKTYLKPYNKLGYAVGEFGTNFVINFITFFLLLYLTDTVGLNSAVIGTLILVAKLLDGISDMIFGNLIDRTHTRWGKARPWLFGSTFPMCIALVLEFAIPNMSTTAQYAYFMVVYAVLNSVFYTANSISFSTLSALITKNQNERVQLGSLRFMFALSAMMIMSIITSKLLGFFGGGTYGWRMTAICYAVFGCVLNVISCLSVKELPEEDEQAPDKEKTAQSLSLIESLKILLKNKFFFILLGINIAFYFFSCIAGSAGGYYTERVLGDPSKFGTLQIAINLPLILTLSIVPAFVNKFGIFKANIIGMTGAVIASILSAIVGNTGNFTLFLVFLALRSIFSAPLMGTINTWTAEVAEYSFLRSGKHIEGSVFSCISIGNKLGSGIGSAVIGWLLAMAGYVGTMEVQPESAISMIAFIYTGIPAILFAIMGILCFCMKVEKVNQELREANK